jgi:hypothetical protein
MLLTGRSLADACRALAVWVAMEMDKSARHPDETVRRQAEGLVALLTPVVKAAFTDFALETAVLSQQVLGGHGYIREWGMEQFVRDARITQIYEGTNGVQAMDLVGRKLPLEEGAVVARFLAMIRRDLREAAAEPAAGDIVQATGAALERLDRATSRLLSLQSQPAEAGAAACEYLRLFALVALGWMWARMATRAASGTSPLHRRKLALARFYAARLLPQTTGLEEAIAQGSASLLALDAEAF